MSPFHILPGRFHNHAIDEMGVVGLAMTPASLVSDRAAMPTLFFFRMRVINAVLHARFFLPSWRVLTFRNLLKKIFNV